MLDTKLLEKIAQNLPIEEEKMRQAEINSQIESLKSKKEDIEILVTITQDIVDIGCLSNNITTKSSYCLENISKIGNLSDYIDSDFLLTLLRDFETLSEAFSYNYRGYLQDSYVEIWDIFQTLSAIPNSRMGILMATMAYHLEELANIVKSENSQELGNNLQDLLEVFKRMFIIIDKYSERIEKRLYCELLEPFVSFFSTILLELVAMCWKYDDQESLDLIEEIKLKLSQCLIKLQVVNDNANLEARQMMKQWIEEDSQKVSTPEEIADYWEIQDILDRKG